MRALLILALLGVAGCTAPGDGAEGVEIQALATSFQNGNPTIAVGESVTFVMIEQSHTVDFSAGDGVVAGVSNAHSGNLNEGESFTVTFTEPGTYSYFCKYHSSISGGQRLGMVGTVTVTN